MSPLCSLAVKIFSVVARDFLAKEKQLQSENLSALADQSVEGTEDNNSVSEEHVGLQNQGSSATVRFIGQEENERKSEERELEAGSSALSSAVIPNSKKSVRKNESVSECSRGFEKSQKRKLYSKKEGTNPSKKVKKHRTCTYQPELPMALKEKIQELKGSEVRLVIEKQLFCSDLRPNNGRFSIPIKQIRKQAENFLREKEEESLDERDEQNGQRQRFRGLPVFVLDPCLKPCKLCLRKWTMERTAVYNLTYGWNSIVSNNHLKVEDTVQLWSFRRNNQLWFALVKL